MKNKIPYDVICAAKNGDEDALRHILKHFEPFIIDSSRRMIRTGRDTMVEVVDEDIRAFIESELVLAIINTYDPYRMPEDKSANKLNHLNKAFPSPGRALLYARHPVSRREFLPLEGFSRADMPDQR